MRTSSQIIQEIYNTEGREHAQAFLHKVLRHTNRLCALPNARRFLAGVEIKKFEPRTVGEAAAEYGEPDLEFAPGTPLTEKILAYVGAVGEATSTKTAHFLKLPPKNVAARMCTLRITGRLVEHDEIICPSGHEAIIYRLPDSQEANHVTAR